jgi:hypothetical protein
VKCRDCQDFAKNYQYAVIAKNQSQLATAHRRAAAISQIKPLLFFIQSIETLTLVLPFGQLDQ